MDTKYINGWKRDMERRGLMPRGIKRRVDDLHLFARWLHANGLTLTVASEDDVQTFLDAKARGPKGIGDRTRYHYVSAIHCFYVWAIKRGGMATEDPTDDIDRPKLRRSLPRPIADSDLEDALASSVSHYRVWFTCAAYAGMRCAEIAGLQREDVLVDVNRVRVLGKGARERVIPMHPLVREALTSWPTQRGSTHLFIRPNGGPWPAQQLSRNANLYLHDLGIEATMHQLRHWFGTRALRASGGNLRVVQELMGHANPSTTAIYTAFADEEAEVAVADLAAHRRSPSTGAAAA